jgi:hypothetical protein
VNALVLAASVKEQNVNRHPTRTGQSPVSH